MIQESISFWSIPTNELTEKYQSSSNGFSNEEAKKRMCIYGTNRLKPKKRQ